MTVCARLRSVWGQSECVQLLRMRTSAGGTHWTLMSLHHSISFPQTETPHNPLLSVLFPNSLKHLMNKTLRLFPPNKDGSQLVTWTGNSKNCCLLCSRTNVVGSDGPAADVCLHSHLCVFSLSVQVCTERPLRVTQRSSLNWWKPAPTSTAETRFIFIYVMLCYSYGSHRLWDTAGPSMLFYCLYCINPVLVSVLEPSLILCWDQLEPVLMFWFCPAVVHLCPLCLSRRTSVCTQSAADQWSRHYCNR